MRNRWFAGMNLLVLTLFSITALADVSCECERSEWIDRKLTCVQGFCVDSGNPSDVVYHLHGSGGDQNSWFDEGYYPSQIREYWRNHNLRPPTVVSVTYGKNWLLASKNSSPASGLFEDFESRLRPKIEAKLPEPPRRRLILGESMGAFNGLQLGLRSAHYDKAAILCAVVGEGLTPFSTDTEVVEQIKTSSAYKYHGEKGLSLMLESIKGAFVLARQYYPTPEEWAPFDPLHLAEATGSQTEFYLASGFHDVFASYEGNAKLAAILARKDLKVDWRPQWGGHCAIDIPSLARFLVE